MRTFNSLVLAGAVVLAAALSRPAGAQGNVQRELAQAAGLTCKFSVVTTGNWQDGKPSAAVAPATLDVSYFNINIDEGTAEDDNGYGKSLIVARFSQGYLHLLHMSDAGPLYLTTVFPKAQDDGRLLAVHTRLEYSPTIVPGFTSRPEMYVGSCAVKKAGAAAPKKAAAAAAPKVVPGK